MMTKDKNHMYLVLTLSVVVFIGTLCLLLNLRGIMLAMRGFYLWLDALWRSWGVL